MRMILILLIFSDISFAFALSFSYVVTFVNETNSDVLLLCKQFNIKNGKGLNQEKYEFVIKKKETLQKSFYDDSGSQLECVSKTSDLNFILSKPEMDMEYDNETIYIKSHKKIFNPDGVQNASPLN